MIEKLPFDGELQVSVSDPVGKKARLTLFVASEHSEAPDPDRVSLRVSENAPRAA